jgi:hypothetical protein
VVDVTHQPEEDQMAQYLLAVYGVEGQDNYISEADMQTAFAQVNAFNEMLQTTGAWVFAGGLHPADTASVVRTDGGQRVVTDGPFSEAKEQIGGFWVVNAADLDVALDLADKGSRACMQAVEVRPFQGE